MLSGSLTALVTPFKDHKVDEAAFADFVEWQIEQGTNGLVPCGTTGETSTLGTSEHIRVMEICAEVVGGAGACCRWELALITRYQPSIWPVRPNALARMPCWP